MSLLLAGVLGAVSTITFIGQARSEKNPMLTKEHIAGKLGPTPPYQRPSNEKESDDAATPIVDFQRSLENMNSDRLSKSRRFDNQNVLIPEPHADAGEVHVESEIFIPDFPVALSDLIVAGVVMDSSAHISADRTGVYSEFVVLVEEVLSNSLSSAIDKNDRIVLDRFGGRVRYPSGQIIRYLVSGRGSPKKDSRYIFFLKQTNHQDFRILTAYELRGEKIFPLDGARVNVGGRGASVYDKHSNRNVDEFRAQLTRVLLGKTK